MGGRGREERARASRVNTQMRCDCLAWLFARGWFVRACGKGEVEIVVVYLNQVAACKLYLYVCVRRAAKQSCVTGGLGRCARAHLRLPPPFLEVAARPEAARTHTSAIDHSAVVLAASVTVAHPSQHKTTFAAHYSSQGSASLFVGAQQLALGCGATGSRDRPAY